MTRSRITITIAIVMATISISLLGGGCSAGEAQPSKGTYTVQFPSTAAAVATDFVQVLIFDVKPEERGSLCADLVTARITRPDALVPSVFPPSPAANICEMRAGRKPVSIPYGEHALLVVAQRKAAASGAACTANTPTPDCTLQDFMIGCAIMTVGDGDAPLPIPVRLISLNQPVPETRCGSVGEYCDDKCS